MSLCERWERLWNERSADAHHNVLRVPWETVAEGTRRQGIDVFVLGSDGRISTVLGFKDAD